MFLRYAGSYITVVSISLSGAFSQSFSDLHISFPSPKVSQPCATALDTVVNCPAFLSSIATTHEILTAQLAESLCQTSCLSSLQSAKSTILKACTDSDSMTVDGTSYPASYVIDQYILAYNTSCTVDSKGALCDPQILQMRADGGINSTNACSQCWLQSQYNALNHPLGYDAYAVSQYASLTSSCQATGYAVASPTAYAVAVAAISSSAATITATASPRCVDGYTVQRGDTCQSVARHFGTSTYNLIQQNNLDLYCSNFAAETGQRLCQPVKCPTYTWQPLDTCASVVSKYPGTTVAQFLSWNPNFNDLCQNGINFVGYDVCIGNPGSDTIQSSASLNLASASSIVSVAQPLPTNAVKGSNANCGRWYTVQDSDTCAKVSLAKGIALPDLMFLNPELNADCTNLWLGNAYCIAPLGDITTYSGYTRAALFTVSLAAFPSLTTATSTTAGSIKLADSGTLRSPAAGTRTDCAAYRYFEGSRAAPTCNEIAQFYSVTVEQLQAWNPSLEKNSIQCTFQNGYSYCMFREASDRKGSDQVPTYTGALSQASHIMQSGSQSRSMHHSSMAHTSTTIERPSSTRAPHSRKPSTLVLMTAVPKGNSAGILHGAVPTTTPKTGSAT